VTTILLLLACGSSAPPPLPDVPFRALREAPAHPPNVLVILLDDVATDRVGIYDEHPQPARTPTIDALAAEGVRFTEAYAHPVCSPSRASLLTGRYARRTGIGFNVRPDSGHTFPDGEGTLAEMLKASPSPYATYGMGKWHLQPREQQSVEGPMSQGFDRWEGAIGNLVLPDSYTDYTWYEADGTITEHASEYLTSREVDRLVDAVQTLPEPWLVWGALHAPHGPWTPPPDELLAEPFPEGAGGADLYDAMLEAADTELARLLDVVDRDDTLIVLLGDNGTPREMVRPPLEKDHGKGTAFEAGVRVPWIVVGPGVRRGVVSDALVSVVDLFPTVAASAGVDPQRDGVPLDGVSLWPLLDGSATSVRSFAFSEKAYVRNDRASVRMVRDARFKLMERGKKRTLHDLRDRHDDGPDVSDGLSPEEQQAYDALKAELDRVKADLGARPSSGCGG